MLVIWMYILSLSFIFFNFMYWVHTIQVSSITWTECQQLLIFAIAHDQRFQQHCACDSRPPWPLLSSHYLVTLSDSFEYPDGSNRAFPGRAQARNLMWARKPEKKKKKTKKTAGTELSSQTKIALDLDNLAHVRVLELSQIRHHNTADTQSYQNLLWIFIFTQPSHSVIQHWPW